jgi:hypothetical protein
VTAAILSDVKPLAQALRDLTPGAPVAHGALTVIPLLAGERPEPCWLTLAEAGAAVTIEACTRSGTIARVVSRAAPAPARIDSRPLPRDA